MQLRQLNRVAMITILALTVLIGPIASADRVVAILEEAYELTIDAISLPRGGAGLVSISDCGGCELKPVSVSSTTRYFFNRRLVSMDEFQSQLDAVRQSVGGADRSGVVLRYAPDSNVATRVELRVY